MKFNLVGDLLAEACGSGNLKIYEFLLSLNIKHRKFK